MSDFNDDNIESYNDEINDEIVVEKKENKNALLKNIFDIVKIVVLAFILSYGIRTFVVTSTIVDGRSMNPTVNHGDRLLVNRLFFMKKNITRGDVIDFYVPSAEKYYLKRVIGVEGDTVELIDNAVYVNGEKLVEDYVSTNITEPHSEISKWVIPEGYVFVLGDNRSNSRDGRDLGPIPRSDIAGKIILRIYPFNAFGGLN